MNNAPSLSRLNAALLEQALTTHHEPYEFEQEACDFLSLPFDFFLSLKSPDLSRIVNDIAAEILAFHQGNKIRDDVHVKFLDGLRIILLNLLVCHTHAAIECLAIPLNHNDLNPKGRYRPKFITVASFERAYRGLLSLEYIQILHKGVAGPKFKSGGGLRTRIAPTERLVTLFQGIPQDFLFFERHPEEETIILRKDKYSWGDKLVEYVDDARTQIFRANLSAINQMLNGHWYDLDLNAQQFTELRQLLAIRHRMKPHKPFFINFASRSLYRIFNTNRFDRGARFYGGWWQHIPKEYRRSITIDNQMTVEVDYSAIHPAMLYAREGLACPPDPYLIEGLDKKFVKAQFNTLLNKSSLKKQPKDYDASKAGIEWDDLVSTILNKHPRIAHHFGTGIGLELQALDAQVAELVLLKFVAMGYPCLPVHDSFIVHHGLKAQLISTMEECYKEVLGGDIGFTIKEAIMYPSDNVIAIQEGTDENADLWNSEYTQRWNSWVNYRKELVG